MALNALAKFAAGCNVTVRHPPDLCVTVTSLNKNRVVRNFTINAENAALTQRVQVKQFYMLLHYTYIRISEW